MSSTMTDPTIILDTGPSGGIWAVAFHFDGKHILGGSNDGIRRWRLTDGEEVGKQTGMVVLAISVSRDHKWILCGTDQGTSVWDAELREEVINVEGTNTVHAVDVSPDSTRFATGTEDSTASVWSISSGERLVGPLKHDGEVTGIQFSPNGEHLATACYGGSVRVFDSHTGDKLITTVTPSRSLITPLSWSNDGQHIFAASRDNKIRSFQVFTGSQLAESQILTDGNVKSVALATNSKFLATYAGPTISFLDATTLSQICPIIYESETINSIALSLNSHYLATGRGDGKITVRELGHILPDLYGPFHASLEERQQDERPSTSSIHYNERFDSTVEEPRKSFPVEFAAHSEDGDGDLLEIEVRSSSPPAEFNYDEPPSRVTTNHPYEEEASPPGTSDAVPLPLDALPTASPPDGPLGENLDMAEPSQGIQILKRLLPMRIRKSNKDSAFHEPDRAPRMSRQAADHQSRSQSPARVEDSNEGPSWMAAGQRVRRAVAKPVQRRKPTSSTKDTRSGGPNKNAVRSGQGPADAKEADPAQQVNDPSQPSPRPVHLARHSDKAILSIAFPTWMCCGSGTGDGTH